MLSNQVNAYIIPEGSFTFKKFCDLNPGIPPVNLLQFITQRTALGHFTKDKATPENGPATYSPNQTTEVGLPHSPAAD